MGNIANWNTAGGGSLTSGSGYIYFGPISTTAYKMVDLNEAVNIGALVFGSSGYNIDEPITVRSITLNGYNGTSIAATNTSGSNIVNQPLIFNGTTPVISQAGGGTLYIYQQIEAGSGYSSNQTLTFSNYTSGANAPLAVIQIGYSDSGNVNYSTTNSLSLGANTELVLDSAQNAHLGSSVFGSGNAISINGGILALGPDSRSQSLGVLTLSQASSLYYIGTGTLSFAGISGLGSSTLKVYNYNPSDVLYSSTSVSNAGNIVFYSGPPTNPGASIGTGDQLSNGDVSPVEPQ